MTITSIPTKTAGDLGTVLTNIRAPVANEFSAVNLEKIKDRIIELFQEVGLTDGSTAGSLWEAVISVATTATNISLPIESGETISPGQAVAVSAVSGRCRRANAVANAAPGFLGVCVTGGTGNGGGTVSASIRVAGLVTGLSVTANTPVYLSTTTAGVITSTVPSGTGNLSLKIGWAVSATSAILQPEVSIIL
ncbi:MAG: hypothetical protein EBS53_00100 [Bacteroidetes bacterium]|nr:hypothetical protein [Bacteroidota bacterium]